MLPHSNLCIGLFITNISPYSSRLQFSPPAILPCSSKKGCSVSCANGKHLKYQHSHSCSFFQNIPRKLQIIQKILKNICGMINTLPHKHLFYFVYKRTVIARVRQICLDKVAFLLFGIPFKVSYLNI